MSVPPVPLCTGLTPSSISFLQLVDEQRKYFKAVKDFQEECTKNEFLEEKLEQLKRQ